MLRRGWDHLVFGRDQVPALLGLPRRFINGAAKRAYAPRNLGVGHERGLFSVHVTRKGGGELSLVEEHRFGSKADMCSAKRHVRFTPESGHSGRQSACPVERWLQADRPNSGWPYRFKNESASWASSLQARPQLGGAFAGAQQQLLR